MIQFRTGPHMGIPYQEARALGLSSALKGREFYAQYVARVQVTKPSERLLGHKADYLIVDDLGPRPTVTLSGLLYPERLTARECQTGYIVGLLEKARDAMASQSVSLPLDWCLPIPFDVLKPARKEKPE